MHEVVISPEVLEMLPRIQPSGLALYCYLAAMANEQDICTPSYEMIVNATGLTRPTISKLLIVLIAGGLIEKRRRFNKSTEYIVKCVASKNILPATHYTTTTLIKEDVKSVASKEILLAEQSPGKATKFQELSSAVVQYAMLPELTGGAPKWVDAIKKMETAGVEPEDIKSCVAWMHERNYSISGPWSLINPAIQEMSKRKRNGKYKKVVEEEVFTEEW